MAKVTAKPLSIISPFLVNLIGTRGLANMTPNNKKGCNEDPGNYRPVSLTSVPGKVIKLIILNEITQHCVGQLEVWTQPAWIHERQVLINQPDLLL